MVTVNQKAMDRISNLLKFDTETLQKAERAADQALSEAWAQNIKAQEFTPLKPSTKKAKARKGLSSMILIATGGLEKGLSTPNHNTSVQSSHNNVSISVSLNGRTGELAGIHMRGGSKLPKRDAVKLTESQKQKVSSAVAEVLLERMRA